MNLIISTLDVPRVEIEIGSAMHRLPEREYSNGRIKECKIRVTSLELKILNNTWKLV